MKVLEFYIDGVKFFLYNYSMNCFLFLFKKGSYLVGYTNFVISFIFGIVLFSREARVEDCLRQTYFTPMIVDCFESLPEDLQKEVLEKAVEDVCLNEKHAETLSLVCKKFYKIIRGTYSDFFGISLNLEELALARMFMKGSFFCVDPIDRAKINKIPVTAFPNPFDIKLEISSYPLNNMDLNIFSGYFTESDVNKNACFLLEVWIIPRFMFKKGPYKNIKNIESLSWDKSEFVGFIWKQQKTKLEPKYSFLTADCFTPSTKDSYNDDIKLDNSLFEKYLRSQGLSVGFKHEAHKSSPFRKLIDFDFRFE